MARSLVLGAGLIGGETARLLVDRGDQVTVATRSGTALPGTTSVLLDAADPGQLGAAARGVDTIFLCTNPPYPAWTTQWPPIFAAAVAAARDSGASLVMMGNLYPYGQARMPMTEHSPELTRESKGLVRKAGWALARAATERGEIRAVEVRASDYFGPGSAATAHLGARFFEPVLAGRRAGVIGDPDAEHSWAYLPDIAATLVAASEYTGDWGRVWHVPSASTLSRAEIARQVNLISGQNGRVYGYPQSLVQAFGWFSPTFREVYASSYQFLSRFVSDPSETEENLGIRATGWDEALATTIDSYR